MCDVAVHLFFDEDGSGQAAACLFDYRVLSAGLTEDVRDVSILVLLDLVISLSSHHQFSEVSVLG